MCGWRSIMRVRNPLDKVQYKLFTLIGESDKVTDEQLQFLAKNFVLVNDHWNLDPKDIDRLHELNINIKITHYRNGSYTQQGTEEYKEVERDLPFGISMYPATFLREDVSMADNTIKVDDAKRLKASREEEDYSKGTRHYVSVIRVGNELMKVIKRTKRGASWQLTIKRNFLGSIASEHKCGDRVFAIIYIGAWGEMPGWPDSKGYHGTHLRYALRIDQDDVREWIAGKSLKILEKGYDGVWFDITSPMWYNQGDTYGNRVTPWNFVDAEEYTHEKYQLHQQGKIERIRKVFDSHYPDGRWITINNIAWASIEHYHRFFNSGIQAASMENFVAEDSVEKWETQINKLAVAAANEYPCIAWAKWSAEDVENRQYERFAFVSYLLGKRKGDQTIFGGRPLLNLPLESQYLWDLGTPVQSFTDVKKYRITASTYRRDFKKGIVLVNPTQTNDSGIALEKEYFNIDTRTWISKIDVPSRTGKILMK